MKRIFGLLALIVSCLLAPGCESGGGGAADGNGGLDAIKLDKDALSMEVGEMARVKAWPVPSMAYAPSFQWASSNPKVASVNDGVITAVGEGEAEITVSSQRVSASLKVTVRKMEMGDRALLYTLRPTSLAGSGDLKIGSAGVLAEEGLVLNSSGALVELDRYYALAERVAEYLVNFSSDTKAVFQSSLGDFKAYVDVAGRKISINTNPVMEVSVPFLKGGRDYSLEIHHVYNAAKVVIMDSETGEKAVLSAVNDGSGGCGAGSLQAGFSVGMQWDRYCFGLVSGSRFTVKRLSVYSLKKAVKLLIYGDSISQPEGYYPASELCNAWTQRVISALGGNAMSSGRGGGTINDVLEYIKNELPFVDSKYVMVTIGTNGGNTEANLTELMQYIISQGRIPILNNIPSNESGTQITENSLIASVRSKLGIKGCLFDLATSEKGDGQTVDKSMMFWEDYSGSYGWQIYHHPNSKGGEMMFERTKIDLPEIYE